jgi:putative CocE/NonD family hydrolase
MCRRSPVQYQPDLQQGGIVSGSTSPTPAREGRSRRRRVLDAAFARRFKLPAATTDYTVTRDLRIRMRDGVELLADHYAPAGPAAGTVLVRGPYGFHFLFEGLTGVPFAARGYHVVLARCRGTYGSGGVFEPMVREVDDGADTVRWLREQPWFGGRFATVGGSYLGFTQWALLMDPPPELAAAVIQVGPHDFSRATYSGGAFNLNDFLGWSDAVAHQEQFGFLRAQLRNVTANWRQTPAVSSLPLANAADRLCQGRAPWFPEWAGHRDLSDPFWSRMQLGAALDRVQVPVLLQTGWQDLFLQQTLEQYERLHRRGVDVALTVGPWTHIDTVTSGGSTMIPESLDWLAEHLAGTGSRARSAAVRIFITGAKTWRDLPDWPPATTRRVLYPQPGGGLADHAAAEDASPATFAYDPADPTPTVGGRLLSPAFGGYRDDRALAARPDVLTFTGPALPEPLEVVGVPIVELAHASDNPHADLFVRISEVDARGRSRNVADGFARLDPASADGIVRLDLDAVAHRFAAGHRIRLLIAGGSFPHWERNLGTDEDPATSTRMAPSRRTIDLADSRVLLPVPV